MLILRKIKSFLSIEPASKLMLAEAYLFLGLGRFLKLLPFSKVALSLGEHMEETTYNGDGNQRELHKISSAIHLMSRYTFWESECLVKAIAGMKMLERRNIECTMYLGTARDGDGKMIAHAWLRSGPFYISGSEGMERFTVVGIFAKKMNNRMIKGESIG
ncbi:lasso peptide biosynthesis B2 protein [Litchfieldia alkalitelluris]|uniref:lasso peptide biosynthesis B2 protein n=1 Tax=Litchfieldia alkalitelluris TaxID=304268 RepID=UPI0009963CB6|nr:lasso peptide biosynthesis B2 protein [Litchfieldia alkalitelluris]